MSVSSDPTTAVTTRPPRVPPGPRGKFFVGNLLQMQKQGTLDFYMDNWRRYGDVLRLQMGPMVLQGFVRPEHVQYVLVKNPQNFRKGLSHDKLRIALGAGLLTSEGPDWQRQRRLMQPTYTPKSVARFAEVMTSTSQETMARWRTYDPSKPIAVNVEMMRLAMSVISRSMFGIDISQSYAEAGRALGFILEYTTARTMSIIDPPLYVPTPLNRRYKHALKTIDTFLYGIIRGRRALPPGDDLLSLLMTARSEETGEPMDEKQLRDEVLVTFFAGHETTAALLSWAAHMLSQHRDVEERLHAELASVLNGRVPTLEDVPSLVYTRMILDETLRLFSPVALLARDTVADDEIDGYQVPAGTMVILAPYLTHRHPEFWQNPLSFDPENFTPERSNARPRYAYYPFGAGPRICIGNHFALLESTLVLADVMQRYRLRLVPGQDVKPQFMGTLRPSRDILMTLEPRT